MKDVKKLIYKMSLQSSKMNITKKEKVTPLYFSSDASVYTYSIKSIVVDIY